MQTTSTLLNVIFFIHVMVKSTLISRHPYMPKSFILLLFLLLNVSTLQGIDRTFEMSDVLKSAFKDISSLKIYSGQQKLNASRASDPNNMMLYYVENYIDFYTLFIEEDNKKYKQLLPNRDIRLQNIKKGDPTSPYFLYCQAEVILQWATIKLKFGEKINAAVDVYEAYNLLKKNKEKFPGFAENNKSLSLIHALSESVPSWLKKIMGIHGSVDMGTREISILAAKASVEQNIFKEEIVAIYSYILFYGNNKKEEAYQLFSVYNLDHKTNPLIAFLKATMAQKTGRNEEAIRVLQERPTGNQYLPFYYLDFMYGKFKLCRLDKDADVYIWRFIKNFNGRHYIKEAYQKLAWYDIVISNNTTGYQNNMKLCIKYGQTLIDEDIQAYKDAKSNKIPNDILLKARLLFDGGYYAKAQNLLILHSDDFVNAIHDGEYYYRLARVTDALKNYVDAIDYYDITIIKSDPSKYYACSSALYAGLICEHQKLPTKARKYFEKCLDLDPAGYASSLHAKAKAGLNRVNN